MWSIYEKLTVLTVALALALLSGCATPVHKSLDEVSVGMDKSEVLEKAGSPWISRRQKSQDHWVYRYYRADQEYRKEIVFSKGKVIKVSAAQRHPDPKDALQEASSMDEYKKQAESINETYSQDFKDVEQGN